MNAFRTEFEVHPNTHQISHDQTTMLIGSCFAQEIGKLLKHSGFPVNLNSHGILFNPISIKTALEDVLKNTHYTEKDLYLYNSLWHSLHHHGSFSSIDKEQTLQKINSSISKAHEALSKTRTLFITFGSAWVFEWKDTSAVVANCHKIPQQNFNKKKLGVNDIISELSSVFSRIQDYNPGIEIILTISPVRYLKEGFVENNWSKATLNIAVHELIRRFDFVSYFPAYELVVDDLRDYRFYTEDMVHPSPQAVNYVWEKFSHCYFDKNTQRIATQVKKLNDAMKHRTIHDNTQEIEHFREYLSQQKEDLKKLYPFLTLEE